MTIKIFRNTYGIDIDITVGVDLTDKTALSLDIRDAAGVIISAELVVLSEETGVVRYTTKVGDMPLYGSYWLQVVIEFGPDVKLRSEWVEIAIVQ
jgi:hypothetical protein